MYLKKGLKKIGGVNFVSPLHRVNYDVIAPVKQISANWVALTPFAFMNPDDPKIYYDIKENWWGDRPEGIKFLVEKARKNNLKILLKPHFWVNQQGWPGDFDLTDSKWVQWEQNFRNYMLGAAREAEKYGIEMFCVGTEFKTAVKKRAPFWSQLIREIRKVYSGKLTYAANWDNFRNVPFWKELDFIGIDSYFPLSDKETPSVDELKRAWKVPVAFMRNFAKKFDKQVVFTEYGYRSTNNAASAQWLIESRSSHDQINLQAQVNAYEALYQAVWEQNWFAGGFLWKWHENHPSAGGLEHSNYTPQNKPVIKTIKRWHEKSF